MARNKIEHEEQKALFDMANLHLLLYPELKYMFAIKNGAMAISIAGGKYFKDEGVKPGVPDIFLPVARGKYHGLFIEMKSPKGRLSPSQEDFLNFLKDADFCVMVAYSSMEAWEYIKDYLNGVIGIQKDADKPGYQFSFAEMYLPEKETVL